MKKIITILGCIFIIVFFFVLYKLDTKDDDKLKKVVVAEVTHSVFYAPQYAAIANGYFEDEGLLVELVLTSGADNVMAAVLSGDVDIGLSGSEATIYVYNGGEKDYIKTFAQLTKKDGSFIVSREDIKDFRLDDMKGKYIIGGRLGGMPEMTLEWSLKEAGIDPKKDLTIDTSIQFASMASAFIGGTGDFVNLFEPLATQVVNQGYGYKIADLGSYGGDVPYTAYNARISYIKENKDVIESFTKAVQKGLDYVNSTDSIEIAKTILDFFPDTSLKDLTSAVDSYKKNDTWPKTTEFTEKSFDHLQEILVSAGQLDKDKTVKYSDLIYVK